MGEGRPSSSTLGEGGLFVIELRENRCRRHRAPEYVVRPAPDGGWRWWLRGQDAAVTAAGVTPTATSAAAASEVLHIRIIAAVGPTEVVADHHGSWRWRLLTRAGQVAAVSTIGFASHWAADRALDRFRLEASHAELVDEEPRLIRHPGRR
jgi:uncharacterized protein YegP (UPF0339 family)